MRMRITPPAESGSREAGRKDRWPDRLCHSRLAQPGACFLIAHERLHAVDARLLRAGDDRHQELRHDEHIVAGVVGPASPGAHARQPVVHVGERALPAAHQRGDGGDVDPLSLQGRQSVLAAGGLQHAADERRVVGDDRRLADADFQGGVVRLAGLPAKEHPPCIIFIDEIDAVGRHRGAGLGGGHDEREQTLNQLLVEMDGFESNEGVILIAATNRPDVLDPALLRPGRFDRQVVVPVPDIRGRNGILKVHSPQETPRSDVDIQTLAKGTPGFSGADLENLVNEAALLAARRNKEFIDMSDFESAKDKVMMGAGAKES